MIDLLRRRPLLIGLVAIILLVVLLGSFPIVPETLKDKYRELVRAHIDALTSKFSELRIDYALLNTAAPLDHALFNYLSMRERMSRVR